MNLAEKKKFIINFFYFAIWSAIIYFILKVAAVYLLPFIIGIFIAYAVQKPSKFISLKVRVKKETCAAILSAILFIFVIVLLALLCWLLYSLLGNVFRYFSVRSLSVIYNIERLYEWFQSFFNSNDEFKSALIRLSGDAISSFLKKFGAVLSNTAASFIKKLPQFLLSCVVTVIATCYISKDYDKLLRFVKGFLNCNILKKIVDFKNIFTECFLKFMIGYFWIFLITLAELMIGFLILRIENFIVVAVLIALLDLLPVIGTGSVLLPWAAFSFLQNNYKLGFGLLILYLFITVLRNVIEPKIIGHQIEINPLFTLLFIFLGFRLGGVFGMLFLPVIIIVLFTYYRRQIIKED